MPGKMKRLAGLENRLCTALAPAKLNLRLKVEGRRADGYHLLSMINVTVDWYDEIKLRFVSGGKVSLRAVRAKEAGVQKELSDPSRNLAVRAAAKFLERFALPCGVELELNKNIPLGAGLGGGSSDAACVLKILAAELRPLVLQSGRVSEEQVDESLRRMALELGADVPFFLGSGFAHLGGVGEEVQDLDPRILEGLSFVLLVPPNHVSTAEVFRLYRERQELTSARDSSGRDFAQRAKRDAGGTPSALKAQLLALVENDLESVVREAWPEVARVLEVLRAQAGSICAMTGSGSALFGVCEQSAVSVESIAAGIGRAGVQLKIVRSCSAGQANS